jgi:hypothetical protein
VSKYIADSSGGGGPVNQAPNGVIDTPSGNQTILVGQSLTFTDTDTDLVTSDATLHLYVRSFPGGTITLGGNVSGRGFSMYSGIVQP